MAEEKNLEELKEEIEFIEHRGEVTKEDIKKTEKLLKELQQKWIHEKKQDQKNLEEEENKE